MQLNTRAYIYTRAAGTRSRAFSAPPGVIMGAPDLPQYRPPSSRPLDAREGRKPFYSHSPSSFATTAATTLTCRSFLNDCAAPFTAQRAAPRREARVSPPREGRKRETEGATLATLLSLAHRVRSTGCARVIYMSRPIQTRTLKVFPLPQRHSFAPAAAATFTRALSSSFRAHFFISLPLSPYARWA